VELRSLLCGQNIGYAARGNSSGHSRVGTQLDMARKNIAPAQDISSMLVPKDLLQKRVMAHL
jgi:hypothetical protein